MLEQWVTDAGHHQAKMKSIPCGEDSDQEEERYPVEKCKSAFNLQPPWKDSEFGFSAMYTLNHS